MSTCALTSGKTRTCRNGFAGIKAVDFTEWENLESVTITDSVVTAMTLADGKRTYRFLLEEETSNFGDVLTGSRQNGTKVSQQTLTMVLNDSTAETLELIDTLAQNRLIGVIHYSDGTYKISGLDNGLMLDTSTHNSGTAHEDRNGEELVFTTKEPTKAPTVGSAIVAALQIPAS